MQTGHIDGMYAKFIEQFEGEKYALECAGIFHSRTFYNFVNSLLYFPIVFVHIIGLRENITGRNPDETFRERFLIVLKML